MGCSRWHPLGCICSSGHSQVEEGRGILVPVLVPPLKLRREREFLWLCLCPLVFLPPQAAPVIGPLLQGSAEGDAAPAAARAMLQDSGRRNRSELLTLGRVAASAGSLAEGLGWAASVAFGLLSLLGEN
ncbi:hypothetical protein NDU88_008615 [Pleurodeles waltl]|uniref:Uncharacterized protein n=1 Tax=Pleurodeles waltl TaxID=8319 RepID=A0AAV7RWL7_PLEWA|nr:hypothetical protein NDU88_008615 [Pleurodeles waltl]